jgi:cobyrinic acid a,c-diamide synthase
VIAGTASGVGKTTVTVGLARALRARGLRVAVFKCGPDYLDPTYHARGAGVPSQNLDGWMMGRQAVLTTFVRASTDADIALIEGVMGLFDGASPTSENGSTAEIAKWLGAPVLLVLDASGMARSVSALASGFAHFDPDVGVVGLVCNRVGSRRHLELLRQAVGTPRIVGGLPAEPTLAFPERHLGLRTADEQAVPERVFARWGDQVREWIDIDDILRIACAAAAFREAPVESVRVVEAPRCRIGLAFDEAFHFYYEDNLRRLEHLGATLVRFSPIHDRRLPDVDGLYLGGGYPEVHAAALERNATMRETIAAAAASGTPLYAECGGLMYLAAAIQTLDGGRHQMVGLFPAEVVMAPSLRALGYVEVETQDGSILGPAGLRFRGHQFRYSDLRLFTEDVERLYAVRRRGGDVFREGYRTANTVASYVHAHWASNPLVAEGFVNACVARAGAPR